MNPNLLIWLFPILAGISTIFGAFLIFAPRQHQNTIIGLSLAFSAGIMVSVSTCSLIPEAISYFKSPFIVFVFLFLGIFLSYLIDLWISDEIPNNDLYRIGIISIITLIIHNIPEGIITFLTTSYDISLGLSISLAIAFHNIPEGIAIAVPIYYATNSYYKAFLYTFISGFSELFGSVLAFFLLKDLSSSLLGITLSMTAGIMFFISISELIPKSLEYKSFSKCLSTFLFGIILMLLCLSVLK